MSSKSELSGKFIDFAFEASPACEEVITTHDVGPGSPTIQSYTIEPMYTGEWIVRTLIDSEEIRPVESEVSIVE